MNISTRVIATIQFLLAAAFVVSAVMAQRFGPDAQAAAEAEVERQGLAPDVLVQHGVSFVEDPIAGGVFPGVIALVLATVGVLNLRGHRAGRTLTWIVQPLVLAGGATIMLGQVFAGQAVAAVLANSPDPAVRGIDVDAVMAAALSAFPAWFPVHIVARFVLATAGSLVVLTLLVATRRRAKAADRTTLPV